MSRKPAYSQPALLPAPHGARAWTQRVRTGVARSVTGVFCAVGAGVSLPAHAESGSDTTPGVSIPGVAQTTEPQPDRAIPPAETSGELDWPDDEAWRNFEAQHSSFESLDASEQAPPATATEPEVEESVETVDAPATATPEGEALAPGTADAPGKLAAPGVATPATPEAPRTFSAMRGRLVAPIATAPRRPFGWVAPEDLHKDVTLPSRGIQYLAEPGAEVRAVYAGEVVFSGWLRGYGHTVVVDHGEGYHTVYAGLAAAGPVAASRVNAGEKLGVVAVDAATAKAGHRRMGDKPLFYFELRRAGAPQDPTPWLSTSTTEYAKAR
jgi:murein hydrolase activator